MKDKIKELFEGLELENKVLEDVTDKASVIFEAQIKNLVEEKLEEEKTKLEEANEEWREEKLQEYDEKFDEYKEMMANKFSEFSDIVLKEEIKIPEKIMEYARLGQIYEPIIEEFKTRMALDQGLIDEEVKGILKEAKEKIVNLTENHDEMFGKVLELEERNKSLEIRNHLLEKSEELTLEQREFVMRVFSDADSVEEIDEKWDVVIEQSDKDWAGGSGVNQERKEKSKGKEPTDDAGKKKGEGFKTKSKDVKKGKDVSGSEGDEETFDKKKMSPENQTKFKEDEDERGKGVIEEGDELDEEKQYSRPEMKRWKNLAFQKRT